jgi:DNA-binding NtrC family response regulator
MESGTPTILVVEDELVIRSGVTNYLRDCGYRVLEASNADEAQVMLNTEDHVGIVFTEVRTPSGMDGFALRRWVQQQRPNIRVILTSGVARAREVARDLCEGGAFMEKPYDYGELNRRIRRALGRAG